jgi:hypothetical protein
VVGVAVDEAVVLDRAALVAQRRVVRLADASFATSLVATWLTNSTACGPRTTNSPMWLTSNTPQRSRTALCSAVMPAGVVHGIS